MLDTGQLPLTGTALSWFREGLTFAAAAAYKEAVGSYNRVLQLNPDCEEVWYERGVALERLGYYADAIASYDRALQLQPRSAEVLCDIWMNRGDALQYGLGDYEAAIASYDQVLAVKPDHALAWHHRANALMYGLDRYQEAIASYDRALAIQPHHYLSWQNRGNALVELERYQEAIASYDRALTIQPDDQAIWHARDRVLDRSGRPDQLPTTNPVEFEQAAFELPRPVEESDTAIVGSKTVAAATSTPSLVPVLVIEDDWGRREIVLEKPTYSIGRDPKNDICLHSQFASRQHATLIRIPHRDGFYSYQMTDGNLQGKRSTNGLMINGRKEVSSDLQHEDVIVFGPQVRAIYLSPPQKLPAIS